MLAHRGREIVAATLNSMVECARAHSGTEEQLITGHGFAEASSHGWVHDEFAPKLTDMEAPPPGRGRGSDIRRDDSLRDWLVGHLPAVDPQYVAHLRADGVQKARRRPGKGILAAESDADESTARRRITVL